MSHSKRKSDAVEPELNKDESTKEKHSKLESTDSDFLRLNDTGFTENNYQTAFETIANKLINSHELVINEQHFFRLSEIEFYFYHEIRHPDTFAHRHPEQVHHSNWYFHRQGTSPTASYKAGTYKGLDITFGSLNDPSYGGILIRSIENKETRQIYEGSCLVVDAILNLCKSPSIKDLVETKLNLNLNVFNKNQFMYLRSIESISNQNLIKSARVGLTLKVPSVERERFLFRSYRFTPTDYYPTKMKMMIILALAAEEYFYNRKPNFIDCAKDLSVKTNTRLSTIMTNLKDSQNGYDTDISKKTSPLVDYYKKTFTTSDLAYAYGIWLRNYRSS